MHRPYRLLSMLHALLLCATAQATQTTAYVRLEALPGQGTTVVAGASGAHVDDSMDILSPSGGRMVFRAISEAAPANLSIDLLGSVSAWTGGNRIEARATWSDQFTIDAPGLNGQRGQLIGHFQFLSWPRMIVAGGGWSELSASSSVRIGTPTIIDQIEVGTGYYLNSWGGSIGTYPGARLTIIADFIFGLPMNIGGDLYAFCGVNNTFACLNSLQGYWDGIESVSNYVTPVMEYTALSAQSRFNYALSAVPEAAAPIQFGVGIGLLAVLSLRRNAHANQSKALPAH